VESDPVSETDSADGDQYDEVAIDNDLFFDEEWRDTASAHAIVDSADSAPSEAPRSGSAPSWSSLFPSETPQSGSAPFWLSLFSFVFSLFSGLRVPSVKVWLPILFLGVFLTHGTSAVPGPSSGPSNVPVSATLEEATVAHMLSLSEIIEAWIVDSGATINICTNSSSYVPGTLRRAHRTVKVANGKRVEANWVGDVIVESTYKGAILQTRLRDVFLIPGLSFNIISVSDFLGKSHGCATMTTEGATMQTRDRQTIVYAEAKDKLFIIKRPPPLAHAAVVSRSKSSKLKLWHDRTCHGSEATSRAAGGSDIPKGAVMEFCETCARDLLKKKSFRKHGSSRQLASRPAEYFATDTCEMPTRSSQGSKYFSVLTCVYSRFTYIVFLPSKSDFFGQFKNFISHIWNVFGRFPAYLRSDSGGEFDNQAVSALCLDKGIDFTQSTTQNPNQNAHAERRIQSVVNMTRAILHHCGLGDSYWQFAAVYSVYVKNRLPHASLNGATPIDTWRKERSMAARTDNDLKYVHVFGCAAWAHIPDTRRRNKLSIRGDKCIFLGVDEKKRGFILQRLSNGTTFVSRDVVFDEDDFPRLPGSDSSSISVQYGRQSSSPGHYVRVSDTDVDPPVVGAPRKSSRAWTPSGDRLRQLAGDSAHHVEHWYFISDNATADRFVPVSDTDRAPGIRPSDPKHRGEAMRGKHRKHWTKAEKLELVALKKNGTWTIVPIPAGRKLITCRWVYKVKLNKDNSIERFKARLVARGFLQKHGIDYQETFAAVALMKSFRILMAYAVGCGWEMSQLDVNNAFLYSEVAEDIYMAFPPGYAGPPGMCLKLNKSIYGLKQAGRNWGLSFTAALVKLGFKQLLSDTCVYQHKSGKLLISVHVDDILIYSGDAQLRQRVVSELCKVFSMRDLGRIDHYLGFGISHQPDGTVCVDQRAYIERMLERYNMTEANPSATPAPPKHVYSRKSGTAPASDKPYRQLIGSLLYAALGTRPDIAQAVCSLSRFNSNPAIEHWTGAKRILRYLKGTLSKGLRFLPGSRPNAVDIAIYSDADWAADPDERKSQSGVVVLLNGTPVMWLSKQQPTQALSSCESELAALVEAIKECMWLRQFLDELGIGYNDPIPLHVDNKSAIALSKNPVNHNKSKHIDLWHKFICDRIIDKLVIPIYVPTGDNIADIFTKSTSIAVFQKLTAKLIQ
jgi:hypothetical protein